MARAGPVWRQYLRAVGPGLITGASDDDPSAIVTYAAAGARLGPGLVWTCTVSLPLMVAVQVNADRLALATGDNVGTLARRTFGLWGRRAVVALLLLHLVANVVVIAADLLAVGSAMALLHLGPAWLWALLAGAGVTVLIASGSFAAIARVLKVLCLALLGYVLVLVAVDVPWAEVGRGLVVPHVRFTRSGLTTLLAVLGATLPPYVFLWQPNHRVEEMREEPEGGDRPLPLARRPRREASRKTRTSAVDVWCGMAFAVVVMFAVIVATAAVTSPGDRIRTTADVAAALEPVAGSASKALFAVGIVGAGLLAIPVLARAASASLMGVLRRPWGYSASPRQAPLFYVFVAVATVGGMLTTLLSVDPVDMLVLAATVNGITAGPLLAVVMVLAGRRDLLGAHRPGVLARSLGWVAVGLMSSVAVAGLALTVG